MLNAKDLELMARYCVQFSIDNGVPRGKAAEAAQDLFMQFSNAGRLTGSGGLRFILGNKYPDYFCKAYLSDQFDREFGPYAIEILRSSAAAIEAKTRSKKADVAPRGHGKSTLDSFAIPTWAAAYQKKKFILFISANYDTSKNFLGKVRKALESPAITEDFGPQVGGAWSAEELCTASGTWVKCAGWKAGLRGMIKDVRPDLICLDDLEDKEVMESLPMQHKLDDCFNNEIGRLGDYNTDFIYIGTLLSEDSLLARTMQNPAWHSRVYKRVISFPDRQDLWDEWRRIYCDISNENRHDDAWAFYLQHKAEMNAGAKVLWEDKVPAASTKYPGGYYNVMLDRVAFGEDAFWQEDQSEPAKASDKPFKTLTFWQARYKEETEYRAALRDITLTVDPSEGKGQDNTAYTLGGNLNGGVGVILGQLRNDKLTAIMDHVLWFCENYPAISEIIFEENTYKEDGTEQLREYLVAHNQTVRVTGFRSEGERKFNRIMQMEPDINAGKILFNQENAEYNTEVLRFSATCAHEDGADSLQVLWKKYRSISGAWLEYLRRETAKLKEQGGQKTA